MRATAGQPSPRLLALSLCTGTVVALAALAGFPYRYAIQPDEMHHDAGHGYRVDVRVPWPLTIEADSAADSSASRARAYEDGFQLGPRHADPALVRTVGRGALAHRDDWLLLSTSDNTDPRTNGRAYTGRHVVGLSWWLAGPALAASLLPVGSAIAARMRRTLRRIRPRRDLRSGWEPRAWARRARGPLLCLLVGLPVAALLGAALPLGSGPGLWLLAGLAAAAAWFCVLAAAAFLAAPWRELATRRPLATGVLVVFSSSLALAAAEVGLAVHERLALARVEAAAPAASVDVAARGEPGTPGDEALPEIALPAWVQERARARERLTTLPAEWRHREVQVPGAREAHYWHGVLHVHDVHRMRRRTGVPPKQPGRLRVAVLGDSLTYGYGIEEEWTYPSQLQRALEPSYDVEFLNLGVSGHSSDEILEELRRFLPRLEPDLVLYGVCLNDFVPAGAHDTIALDAYAVPVPDSLKAGMLQRSRVARLAADGYDALLRTAGLRIDFLDEVLRDARDYRGRFTRDVAAMNSLVLERGLPPIVAMVLTQDPVAGGREERVTRVAEQALRAAGMNVIPSEGFLRRFDGRRMRVSRWEAHPNEEAHAVFAAMFRERLLAWPGLEAYRRDRPHSLAASGSERRP